MRKASLLIVCIILTVSGWVANLTAQTAPHVYLQISSATVTLGDTVRLTVGVDQGDSIKSVLLLLNYTESKYRFLNGTSSTLFQGATFWDIHPQSSDSDTMLYMVGVTLGAGRYVKAPGEFFILHFVAKDTGQANFGFDSLRFMTPSLRYFAGTGDNLSSVIFPVDTFPPAAITDFRVQEAGSGKLQFQWHNPNDEDFMGVTIIRSTAGFADSLNTPGTFIAYSGRATGFEDANLDNHQIYYYSAFTFDEIPNYSRPVYLKAEPKAEYIYAYPNPFNPSNGVHFKTIFPYDTFIDISIYDAVGNLVLKLYKNEPITANDPTKELIWDGRNADGDVVANGVYYYIVKTAQGDKKIEKVAVLR